MSEANVKLYLEYLDKEMTIMGVLSTFAVAGLSLVLNKILSAEENKQELLQSVWIHGSAYIIAASVLMLLSALYIYRQRSLLAWYYGQICLSLIRKPWEVEKLLDDADSWETWIYYRWGFGFLFLAFGDYILALASIQTSYRWLESHVTLCTLGPFLIVFSYLLILQKVFTRYKFDDEPFRTWWNNIMHYQKL